MVKNKKRKKRLPKKKLTKKSVSLSRFFDVHTRVNRHKISTFKRIVTKKRIYIFFAALTLIIVASTAAYALNNTINPKEPTPKPSSTNGTFTSEETQTNGNLSDSAAGSLTTKNPEPASCYEIQVSAESQFLKSTNALVYPHYGDSRAIFDAYNGGYRQAYNTYLNSVKAHNCSVTIVDKGTVQYASPTCTKAYSDNLVVVLRNQIYSAYNLDMNEYKDWLRAGHHSSWDSSYQSYSSYQSEIAGERNVIQNKDNARVRGYVNDTNTTLSKIYCPSLNPADFYNVMF